MIGRASTFLGLAVGDRAIACAEVAIAGNKRAIRRTATFAFANDLSFDRPEALGQALAAFLRQHRFGSSRAVVGIPARWLVAIEKGIPPADPATARATLRLQAERLAISENGDLVFDFAGQSKSSAASRVLLVGVRRDRLDKIGRTLGAAGMQVVAITSSGLALASCVKDVDPDGAIVVLTRGGAEMIWRESGLPRTLRYVALATNGHGPAPIGPLSAELRRTMTLAPAGVHKNARLLLLNGIGIPETEIAPLAERAGLPLAFDRGLALLNVVDQTPADQDQAPPDRLGEYGAATALAIAGAQPSLMPVDFRHSRLAPPRKRRVDRRIVIGVVAGIIAIAVAVALFVSVQQRQHELDDLTAQLTAQKPQVDQAKALVDRVTLAEGFFPRMRPQVLECLRQITLAFKDDDPVWITSFGVRDTGSGQLAGKASDRQIVLTLLDRLKRNNHFLDFKLLEIRDTNSHGSEITFSMSFIYKMTE